MERTRYSRTNTCCSKRDICAKSAGCPQFSVGRCTSVLFTNSQDLIRHKIQQMAFPACPWMSPQECWWKLFWGQLSLVAVGATQATGRYSLRWAGFFNWLSQFLERMRE